MDNTKKRILELDYMRGFALLGIILINIISIIPLPMATNKNQADYLIFIDFFIENKFFSIFSFLFGIGFYIFVTNLKNKSLNSVIPFTRRLSILACLGMIHQLLQPGEALLSYSIIGFLLIPCFYLSKHTNLIIGLGILIICLYIGNKTLLPIPYFILGLSAGQFNVFENIKHKILLMLTMISGVLSIISWYLLNEFYVYPSYKFIGANLTQEQTDMYMHNKDIYDHLIIITSPLIALFYVTVLLLLIRIQFFRKIFNPLQLYGKMALTNYIGQTLLIWIAILLLNDYKIDYINTLWICLVIYILQLIVTSIWLKYFKYGPLEYVWRVGTYWQLFSILKTNKEPHRD